MDDAPPRGSRSAPRPAARPIRDDRDDDRPARRPADDYDDEPRGRRRVRDDDETEVDRRRDDPDRNDDGPVLDRADDDYDDLDEDRPRKKRPKRKKKAGKGLLIAGLLVGVFGFLAVAGLVVWMVWPRDKDPLAYLPANSNMVFSINVGDLASKNPDLAKKVEDLIKQGDENVYKQMQSISQGASIGDFYDRVVVGARNPDAGSGGGAGVIVVKTKKPYDRDAVIKAFNATSAELEGKTYYKVPAASGLKAMFFPSDKLVVLSSDDNAEVLKELLKSDGRKVLLQDALKDMADKIDKNQVWMAMVPPSSARQSLNSIPTGPGGQQLSQPAKTALSHLKSVGFWGGLESDQVKIGAGLLLTDSSEASQLVGEFKPKLEEYKKQIDGLSGMVGFMPGVPASAGNMIKELTSKIDFVSDGSVAQVTTQVSRSTFDSFVKDLTEMGAKAAQGGGQNNGPPNFGPGGPGFGPGGPPAGPGNRPGPGRPGNRPGGPGGRP
jgi:hypothetical protein